MKTHAQLARAEAHVDRLVAESVSLTLYLKSIQPGTWSHRWALASLARTKAQLQAARRAILRHEEN